MPSDDAKNLEETMSGRSKIQEHFAGKSIFLTGATGFMGKCFVEKVLRDIPDLNKLYVLVREKNGVSQEEKMKKYFKNQVFDNLRKVNPSFEEKVVTINGDLQEDKLGLSATDRQLIIDEIDVFVHNGATTKFDEKVSVALKLNVLATKHMLDLAMASKRIRSFTYVSTAYSHCYNKDIEEKFYDAPADLKAVYDMIEADTNSERGLTQDAIQMLLGQWPNVYCFTKSMAEDLVRQYGNKSHFPCAVWRPSIVSAAYKQPIEGWIGNQNGPGYMLWGAGIGAIHCAPFRGHPVDMIPVDYSINALIGAVYDQAERWEREKRPLVYNYGSSVENPMLLDKIYKTVREEGSKVSTKHLLWYPFVIFCPNMFLFLPLHILLHFIPGIFADIALLCMGKKPMALSIFWFATKHLKKLDYFANGNWRIHVKESMKINDKLLPKDKEIFYFDIKGIDWAIFSRNYILYMRIHIFKEPLETVPQTVLKYKRLRALHYSLVAVLSLILIYYMLRLVNIV